MADAIRVGAVTYSAAVQEEVGFLQRDEANQPTTGFLAERLNVGCIGAQGIPDIGNLC